MEKMKECRSLEVAQAGHAAMLFAKRGGSSLCFVVLLLVSSCRLAVFGGNRIV
jgi:hypothetical protein